MRESLGLSRAVIDPELTRSGLTDDWLATCETDRCRDTTCSDSLTVTCEVSVAGVITLAADPLATWVSARGEINDGRGKPSEARFSCGRRRGNVPSKGRTR